MKKTIPYGKHFIDQDDIDAVVDVLTNHPLTQGKVVSNFERSLAKFVGAKYAVAMSSWTAGLHMACIAAGVNETNKIITSPITFVATSNASFYCGSKPIFSDIDMSSVNLCPKHLERTLSENKNVKAIIPVHFAGVPCEMEKIKIIADKNNAMIIEDAAHALGAKYPDGSMVGSCKYSDMTGFSFHPVKSIAAGEGGMITTNNKDIYRRLIRLRSHGINKSDDVFSDNDAAHTENIKNPWYMEMQELGYNYRITDIQCALANSQLKKLPDFIKRRKELAERYDKAFLNFKPIKLIQTQYRDQSSYHLYVIKVNFDSGKQISRATLMTELHKKNILTQVHYIPVTSHPYYKRFGFNSDDYPNALGYYKEALSIPLYYSLTNIDQDKVISSLKELLA